jgi:4-amino-4-deoxy-L-arabinose transferase-like glycosyltransferase
VTAGEQPAAVPQPSLRERLGLALTKAALHPDLSLTPFLLVYFAVTILAPANENLYDDEAGYLGLAHLLTHGRFLTGRDDLVDGGPEYPNLWFGPGLPLVLAPFVALHVPVELLRLVGPLCLFAAVLVFRRLLTLAVAPRAAFVGAAALALFVPLYTVIAFLHSEPLALLLVVFGLYATARHVRFGGNGSLIGAGAAFAGLALTRVAFGWILALLVALYGVAWARRRTSFLRRLTAIHVIALAFCVPWLAYTYGVTHHVFYWGSSGALSLYWMSSPQSGDRGDWHGADSVFRDPQLAPHRPLFRRLEGLPLVEQNRALERGAIRNVVHHPLKFAWNIVENVSRMLFNVPYSFKAPKMTSLVYAVPTAILLIVLALSAVGASRPRAPEALPIAALLAATFALHAVLAGYPRLLFPIVPAVIWFAVVNFASRSSGSRV